MISAKRLGFINSPRTVFATLLLAALALGGSSGCTRSTEAPKTNGNAPKGATKTAGLQPLPPNATETEIKTIDGKSLRLSDFAGKVVVLDLWATWCPPCREEIPHLVEMSKEFKERGVEVVGLTLEDPVEDSAKVQSFAKQFNINYQIGWAETGFARSLMSGTNYSIPQTMVITRDGRILKRFIGFDKRFVPQMRQAIEQALNTASAT